MATALKDIGNDILRVLGQNGSQTLCELYQFLPDYDSSNGELDGPLLELERAHRVYSSGTRRVRWGKGILWHVNSTEGPGI